MTIFEKSKITGKRPKKGKQKKSKSVFPLYRLQATQL